MSLGGGQRKPPSQRNSEHTEQRLARAVQSMSPGSMGGRVANAALVPTTAVKTTSAPAASAATPVLWIGPEAPTDGSVFWYDTDATC